MINNYNNNNQNYLQIYFDRIVSPSVNCYTIVNARSYQTAVCTACAKFSRCNRWKHLFSTYVYANTIYCTSHNAIYHKLHIHQLLRYQQKQHYFYLYHLYPYSNNNHNNNNIFKKQIFNRSIKTRNQYKTLLFSTEHSKGKILALSQESRIKIGK